MRKPTPTADALLHAGRFTWSVDDRWQLIRFSSNQLRLPAMAHSLMQPAALPAFAD